MNILNNFSIEQLHQMLNINSLEGSYMGEKSRSGRNFYIGTRASVILVLEEIEYQDIVILGKLELYSKDKFRDAVLKAKRIIHTGGFINRSNKVRIECSQISYIPPEQYTEAIHTILQQRKNIADKNINQDCKR